MLQVVAVTKQVVAILFSVPACCLGMRMTASCALGCTVRKLLLPYAREHVDDHLGKLGDRLCLSLKVQQAAAAAASSLC